MTRIECQHGALSRSCELCELAARVAALESAARAVLTSRGRHHSQLALCKLGDLMNIPTVHPGENEPRVAP